MQCEYILLKLDISALGNDHLTVGILSIINGKFKCAFTLKPLVMIDKKYRMELARFIASQSMNFKKYDNKSFENLNEVFHYRTGRGSALWWDKGIQLQSISSETIFNYICSNLKII